MKKFFVLTLITFAFLLAQLALPLKTVTVDDDVGICYVAPMDQVTVDMVYVADYTISTYLDYQSSIVSGVEKSDYLIILNSTVDAQYMYDALDYGTPANQKATSQKDNHKSTDLGGLLTNYVSPRDGVTANHSA